MGSLRKEIIEKAENKKNRNTNKNLLKKFLQEKKEKFIKNLYDIGYEKFIIDLLQNPDMDIPTDDINSIW